MEIVLFEATVYESIEQLKVLWWTQEEINNVLEEQSISIQEEIQKITIEIKSILKDGITKDEIKKIITEGLMQMIMGSVDTREA